MSSVAFPTRAGQPARLRARAAVRLRAARARITMPAPMRRLAEIPLTVAGIGCIDAAAFEGGLIAGLVVTGLSLVGLEYLIADSE